MDIKRIIYDNDKNEYLLYQDNILPFEVWAKFSKWEKVPDSLNHSENIKVFLRNITRGHNYRLSKLNYCQDEKTFEIHVEYDGNGQNKFHSLEYKTAVKDKFDLTGKRDGGDGDKRSVRVLIYNRDIAGGTIDTYYMVCGRQGGRLNYPRTERVFDKEIISLEPEVKKGNILVGKN